jgi:hypothetical protein
MGQYNLECIFKPRHVAVVDASEKAGTIGNALIRNLIEVGFAGKRDRESLDAYRSGLYNWCYKINHRLSLYAHYVEEMMPEPRLSLALRQGLS